MKTDTCCSPKELSGESCGCCEGVERLTPRSTANRPGISELAYRIGTHAEFLETMQARLSSYDFQELKELTTRDSSDPSLALLDAWAALADVLTFYQERIANEGYLRTAKERRSILELGRLVGYKMRPGVSASAFLSYTIDENTKEEVKIPAGSRVQSIPGPDEMPQTFESSEDLKARSGWNNLRPRMTQPQTAEKIKEKNQVYFKGIMTNLKPNDRLLIDFDADNDGDSGSKKLYRVTEVKPDAAADRTLVGLILEGASKTGKNDDGKKTSSISELIDNLIIKPSLHPANRLRMGRKVKEQFVKNADVGYRALVSAVPALGGRLTAAAKNATFTKKSSDSEKKIKIYALRKKASPFGRNAPLQPVHLDEVHKVMKYKEWDINNPIADAAAPKADFTITTSGLEATFKNKSSGPFDSVIWFFDDGAAPKKVSDPGSLMLDQSYEYPRVEPNNTTTYYKVTLVVTGPGGTDYLEKTVTIITPDNSPH
jgi:hypothetical protein